LQLGVCNPVIKEVLIFAVTRGHQYTVQAILEGEIGAPAPVSGFVTYDALFRAERVPRATFVFTDIERLYPWEARLAADMFRSLKSAGLRCLNDPARVLTRYELLRTLYRKGINPFDVYRAENRPKPKRFPVFVRGDQDHDMPYGGLLSSQSELDKHLDFLIESGTPLRGLIIVEFCAEPVCAGIWRKFGSFCIGGRMHIDHHVTEGTWLVKSGNADISPEWLYLDEYRRVTGDRCPDAVTEAFRLAGIDYGRADHAMVEGREVIYEINTNPYTGKIQPHKWKIRDETLAHSRAIMGASLFAIDSGDGKPVPIVATERVRRHRIRNGANDRSLIRP